MSKTERESFGFVLLDTARAYRRAFEAEITKKGMGITPGMARVLAYIYHYPGLRQNQVAEGMMVEPMTVVGHLDALERAGFVERKRHPEDRRSKMTEITGKGLELVEQLKRIGEQVRGMSGPHMSAEEFDALQDRLREMRDQLSVGAKSELRS
ncbi:MULTISPECIES: MarR family winged helix-turn-helix transcriptional regulator [Pseudovibrio]|uniref:MarR family winged helix-turn-helix transcriptional regulator n=1 Tax=Stappiaceae TaxID=2821832 RepID=UPI0023654F5A|nr:MULTISPECIES: MarR family transcriptional regulator [Pseudovibrio]MDD7909396.1 MarR family transcriptional regulator [Pseudovibrio exalbescens]MDX5594955.1 MarR family transcriptional regulator [Pseudovibrio sp. SPO723]